MPLSKGKLKEKMIVFSASDVGIILEDSFFQSSKEESLHTILANMPKIQYTMRVPSQIFVRLIEK